MLENLSGHFAKGLGFGKGGAEFLDVSKTETITDYSQRLPLFYSLALYYLSFLYCRSLVWKNYPSLPWTRRQLHYSYPGLLLSPVNCHPPNPLFLVPKVLRSAHKS